MRDSGMPHCCVAVNVETAKGSIVESAWIRQHTRDGGGTRPMSSLAKITIRLVGG